MMPLLDPEARSRINGEMQPGERLLWSGQPDPGLYARGGWGLSVFGIFFTGFSLFWIAGAGGMMWFSDDGPSRHFDGVGRIFSCFPLFGLPFLAVGIGMLTSPIWMRRAARRTVYAVTDRRAIVCQGGVWGSVTVRSFGPSDLTDMTRVERAGGGGDLVFREHFTESYNSKGHRMSSRTRIGFIGIDGVREVENLIRAQLVTPSQARDSNGEGA